jgi:hypothetical protein
VSRNGGHGDGRGSPVMKKNGSIFSGMPRKCKFKRGVNAQRELAEL